MKSSPATLMRVICHIDLLIHKQVNCILHHADFQRLEASWRGLHFLVKTLAKTPSKQVQIRLLCLNQYELAQDIDGAIDFDQTLLFQKIYTEEYDQPGGKPFGLIIADYSIDLQSHVDWVACLQALGAIAAAIFAPLIIDVAPAFLGLNHFSKLHADIDLTRTFQQALYQRWQRLRHSENARFLYAVLPRVMWRKPYQHTAYYLKNHAFYEAIEKRDDYLWGGPGYVLAAMVIKSYVETQWFTQLREQDIHLDPIYFSMDTQSIMPISRLDASLSELIEQDLADHGLTAIVESAYHFNLELRSCRAIQISTRYHDDVTNLNAQAATMLPYLLCACRFAHYLKIIARDKVGSFSSAETVEKYLQDWIFNYCGHADVNNLQQLSRYPLRDAAISVAENSRAPGDYFCKMDIKPNYHIEKINTRLRFITTMRDKS